MADDKTYTHTVADTLGYPPQPQPEPAPKDDE